MALSTENYSCNVDYNDIDLSRGGLRIFEGRGRQTLQGHQLYAGGHKCTEIVIFTIDTFEVPSSFLKLKTI